MCVSLCVDRCYPSFFTQYISVWDNDAPTFTGGLDPLTLECGSDLTPTAAQIPTATDTCNPEGISFYNLDDYVEPAGACKSYQFAREWTAIDVYAHPPHPLLDPLHVVCMREREREGNGVCE